MTDQEKLFDFLEKTQYVLGQVVEHRDVIVPEPFWQSFLAAWEEVLVRFNEAFSSLETEWPKYTADLESVGLTGSQLDFKHQGFSAAFYKWQKMYDWQKKMFKRALLDLLRWINLLLGSLASLFMWAEAIKEFKESIERFLEEDLDKEESEV